MPSLALAIRPDDWDFPLFVHVLGAMILVGGLLTCVVAIVLSRGDARLLRIGWISLLVLGLPGWIAMRAGAEWIYSKEGWGDLPSSDEPADQDHRAQDVDEQRQVPVVGPDGEGEARHRASRSCR